MTLPDERYRSLVQTKEFLLDLLSAHQTPRVPKLIRKRAYSLLRHWPDEYHLEMMTVDMSDHFSKEIEPVTRLFKQYEDSKVKHNET